MDNRHFQADAGISAPNYSTLSSVGFLTNGNAASGVPATLPGAAFWHQLGEELRNAIIAGDITPDHLSDDQLAGAIANIAQKKIDESGISQSTIHIIQAYNNGTSWYRIWNNGYCEQGGYIPSSATSANTNVRFLVDFYTTNYVLFVTTTETEVTKTLSDFTLSECSNGFIWVACGYTTEEPDPDPGHEDDSRVIFSAVKSMIANFGGSVTGIPSEEEGYNLYTSVQSVTNNYGGIDETTTTETYDSQDFTNAVNELIDEADGTED